MYYSKEIDNVLDIAKEIIHLINKHHSKISFISKYHPNTVFNYLKHLPYKRDSIGKEFIISPHKGLKQLNADCKKKSIIWGSYLKNKKIPFRIVLVSNKLNKKFHHIYIQIKNKRGWINTDNTYSYNYIGQPKKVTNFQYLYI